MKTEILARMIDSDDGRWTEEAAKSILQFKLAPKDVDRVNDLAAKARAGTLTANERGELDDYELVTCLVDIMQSKARRSLREVGVAG